MPVVGQRVRALKERQHKKRRPLLIILFTLHSTLLVMPKCSFKKNVFLFLVITTFFVGEYVNRLPTDQSFWKAGVMVSHA
jgi:hypothetical protein